MDASNPQIPNAKLAIVGSLSSSWRGVHGFKFTAWASTFIYVISSILIVTAVTLLFILTAPLLGISLKWQQPSTNFLGNYSQMLAGIFYILSLILLIAPLVIGFLQIPIRYVCGNVNCAFYAIFDGFRWRNLWRVGLLVLLALFCMVLFFALAISLIYYFDELNKFTHNFAEYVLIPLAVLMGLALTYSLIIFSFAQLLVVDKNFSLSAGLKTAVTQVRGNYWRLIMATVLWYLVQISIQLVVAACFIVLMHMSAQVAHSITNLICFIISIWLLPWSLLWIGVVYQQLFGYLTAW